MAGDDGWLQPDPSSPGTGWPGARFPISSYAAGLADALSAYGDPGARDALSILRRQGLASALLAYPAARAASGDQVDSGSAGGAQDAGLQPITRADDGIVPAFALVQNIPDLTIDAQTASDGDSSGPGAIQSRTSGQDTAPQPITASDASVGLVPPSALVHNLPDLRAAAQTAPDGGSSELDASQDPSNVQAVPQPAIGPGLGAGIIPSTSLVRNLPDPRITPQSTSGRSPSPRHPQPRPAPTPPKLTIFRSWTLPNGQVARQYDAVRGPNVVYHHGDLGGVAGVYVDDPDAPGGPRSIFTPTGPKSLATTPGFFRSPQIGPAGQPYYDKLLWDRGGRQGFLRVDAQGHPVKAFVLDNGEVHDAPSPTDYIGPGEVKLLLDLGLAAAVKAGAPALLKAGAAKLAASGVIRNGEKAAVEGAEEPVIQLGGAHRDVQGLAGYEAHHIPADAASPLSKGEGPAIAMRPADHRKTASWGRRVSARLYRQRQADLIGQGRFREAVQMDIDDIRKNFGTKYDEAIRQMMSYIDMRGY